MPRPRTPWLPYLFTRHARPVRLCSALTLLTHLAIASVGLAADPVEFNRHVRPILSDRCFTCHGPDANKREADLRLDKEAAAKDELRSVIVPGEADSSELILRVTHDDPDLRMPPGSTGKALSDDEIAILRNWIEQGATWQEHWSLIPPTMPEPPAIEHPERASNEIDRFVLARLDSLGIAPAELADRRTLIRRLSFDLLGLPPTPGEVDTYLNDTAPGAYERLVDRLLASQHFGERMAVYWLDVVRYADTGGYHSDNHRDVWMYRDYVIESFNNNLPFDQFTREQIAGDLLPDATPPQQIASGYNRLLQTTQEGGAQPKEYTAKYLADRVRNTATAWLGLTMGCCECHDHKFDPLTMRDFYSFGAFFADLQERAVGHQDQTPFPTVEQQQQMAELNARLESLRGDLNADSPEFAAGLQDWIATARANLAAGGEPQAATSEPQDKKPAGKPAAEAKLPDDVLAALQVEADQRTDAQQVVLDRHYRTIAPALQPVRDAIAAVEKQQADLRAAFPQSLISISVAPRTVRILPRGNWLDDSGEVVEPAAPEVLGGVAIEQRGKARLALANWLTSRDNPLTARVFVNRLWKLAFGEGLVRSLDDFGTQGAPPTHAELLDWLAVDFMEHGWDVKRTFKAMLMSRTYRQSSRVTPELLERDPNNRLLARQARFRLDAELIRDNALAISGLLSDEVGGPSVKPYQPAGYWQHLNFPKRAWQQDRGGALYRRGLYTYWQRSFLHPSLLAFDAPSREECTVERPRSNTPLQALVLLNDPTYVEAARVLAAQMVEYASDVDGQLDFAFRRALNRLPEDAERDVLRDLYARHAADYEAHAPAAAQLVAVGEAPRPQDVDPAELAAATSLARVILNLHETITRH